MSKRIVNKYTNISERHYIDQLEHHILSIISRKNILWNWEDKKSLQSKIDDFFIKTSKEIKYIFIPYSRSEFLLDSKKWTFYKKELDEAEQERIEILNSEMQKLENEAWNDENKQFEIELLKLWFAFEEELVKKFARIQKVDQYQEEEIVSWKKKKFVPYEYISIRENWDSVQIQKFPKYNSYADFNRSIISTKADYRDYKKLIIDLGLNDFYDIEEYDIALKKDKKQDFQKFLTSNENKDNFEELLFEIGWQEVRSHQTNIQQIKTIFYIELDNKKIQKNKEILEELKEKWEDKNFPKHIIGITLSWKPDRGTKTNSETALFDIVSKEVQSATNKIFTEMKNNHFFTFIEWNNLSYTDELWKAINFKIEKAIEEWREVAQQKIKNKIDRHGELKYFLIED